MALYAFSSSSRIGKCLRNLSVALPLATLACVAAPALADSVTFGVTSCKVGGQTGSCTGSVVNTPGGSSATATITSPLTGGQSVGHTSGVTFDGEFTGSGTLSPAQQFTLSYDFFVDRGSSQTSSLTYDVGFQLQTYQCQYQGTNCFNVDAIGLVPTGTGLYEVQGSQSFTIPGSTLANVSIGLLLFDPSQTVSYFSANSGSVSLSTGILPSAAVTPEPASFLLASTGMALAAFKRRRRNRC